MGQTISYWKDCIIPRSRPQDNDASPSSPWLKVFRTPAEFETMMRRMVRRAIDDQGGDIAAKTRDMGAECADHRDQRSQAALKAAQRADAA